MEASKVCSYQRKRWGIYCKRKAVLLCQTCGWLCCAYHAGKFTCECRRGLARVRVLPS